MTVFRDLGWLVTFVASWAIPLGLDRFGALRYSTSLLFWVIPLPYLARVFFRTTEEAPYRRRRALLYTTGAIVTLGLVLDFLLGHKTLRFDCTSDRYLACLPAVGGQVPIEEVFFYILGPIMIVLVYACADEAWVRAYNRRDLRLAMPATALIRVVPRLVAVLGVLVGIGAVFYLRTGRFPTYYAFLVVGALIPAVFLYDTVRKFVNWPAFALTTFYLIGVSLLWEVTLAIPRQWWNYNENGMLGVYIDAWSHSTDRFPIEAAIVWLCAPFSSILLYEFVKAVLYHPAKTTRQALIGVRSRGSAQTAPDRRSLR